MKKYCHHCRSLLLKRYKESQNQWAVRKFCNRRCSGFALSSNQIFKDKSRNRMIGNKINVGRRHLNRKSPPPMTHEVRERIRKTLIKNRHAVAEKNHFWKGGVTPMNIRLRASGRYKLWRTRVFERDDYTCQMCSVRGGKLEADHIKQFAFYPDVRFDVDNGRTLCHDCHIKTPTFANNKRAIEC